jgi:hypothetical protein
VTNSIATFRHLRLLGFALGAVAIAAGAVWITASAAGLNIGFRPAASTSTPSPKAPSASTACNDFVSHFASDLGTTQTKVDAAFQKAVGQTLDDEVKNGDITQAQADAIKKKIAGQAPCALMPSAPKAPRSDAGAYKQALLGAAASALGITDQELMTDLAQGMTLSQIAAAQNPPVTEAQFRDRRIAKLTPLLDAAVTKKQLTAAQEQAIIQQLKTGPIPFWDKPMPATRKPATASPAAT